MHDTSPAHPQRKKQKYQIDYLHKLVSYYIYHAIIHVSTRNYQLFYWHNYTRTWALAVPW